MPRHAIGHIIRQRRLDLGLTQKQLAEHVTAGGEALTQADISRIESGQIKLPRPARLQRIAAALDISLGDLLLHATGVDNNGRVLIEQPADAGDVGLAAGDAPPSGAQPPLGSASQPYLWLLENVGQAVIVCDLDGTIRYWNAYAEQLYGWSADEAVGGSTRDLIVAADAEWQELARDSMRLLSAGRRWSGEFRVRRRDGRTFMVQLLLSPVLDQDGNVVAIFGSSHEIDAAPAHPSA